MIRAAAIASVPLAGAALVLLAVAASAECRADLAELRWEGGSARFNVEIADTADERARGLMFRSAMPRSAGMLFVYPQVQPVAFWMRNTLIPLDMLFIDHAGLVLAVHENAVPGDETAIPGPPGTQHVLEINAGLSRRLGLRAGAQLRSSAIAQQTAAWPCAE